MEGVETLALADGRRLAYAQFGDPSGAPLVFLHGWGDSRLTRHPDDSIAASAGVRLITVDRPGAGRSDFQPGRRLLDWPRDVAALADSLAIDRFALLGWSGAGPHAAACAHALPDRVTRLGIACGFAPVDSRAARRGLPRDLRLGMPLLRTAPWVARLFFAGLPRQYRRDPARAFERQWKLAGADRDVLYTQPGVRANLVAGAAEALRQGARGLAHELGLLFGRPWGFEPSDIRVPTHLWYGTDDALVPLAMGERLAREIRGARLTVCRGEGHLLVFTHWAEMLRELTAAPEPARAEALA